MIPLDPLSKVTLTDETGIIGEKPDNARIALFYLSEEEEYVDELTGELRNLEHRVWFSPDGHFTQFGRQNGELVFSYEGNYFIENGQLGVKMLGMEPLITIPLELKDGNLRMDVDFLQKESDRTPLTFSKHTYFEPKNSSDPSYYVPVNLAYAFAKVMLGEEVAKDSICEVVDQLQSGWLVRCFSMDENSCVSLGWWVINVDGPCYDYISGDTLYLQGMEQKVENGFVKAELQGGEDVFVTFEDSPLLKAYIPKVKVGKKYPIAGLNDRIFSIQVEYARLDYTPYLLMKEGDGGASICNLMQMTEDGKFEAHSISVEEPIIEFDVGEMLGGEAGPVPTIFAHLESGTLINALTSEYVDFSPQSSAEDFDPDIFVNEVYPTLECLKSCDLELFGAQIDESIAYSAGMTTVEGIQQVGVLYPKGEPLPQGFEEDPGYADYYLVKNFRTNSEVWEHLSHYLSEKVIHDVFHNDFLEYDGKLYLQRGGRGYGAIVCEPDTACYLRKENDCHVLKIDYWAFGEYDHTAELYMMNTSEGWKIAYIISKEGIMP